VKLKTLRLGYNGLNGDGVAAMAAALESNSVLTDLDLTCNRITDNVLSRLAQALSRNETLTHLRVGFVFSLLSQHNTYRCPSLTGLSCGMSSLK
jgi:Ran GTPase-activating protein (RanGAP) involved in mRNA processing and transport